jgi:Fur family zinc uptake transcriptional regulator
MSEASRLTPLRREVFELVKAAPRPIKAYELLARLCERRGSAKPPTVYRVLAYLTGRGMIHRIESLNAYAACVHGHARPDHVFLICEACGDVAEIESLEAGSALGAASQQQRFSLHHASIELKGACRTCDLSVRKRRPGQ